MDLRSVRRRGCDRCRCSSHRYLGSKLEWLSGRLLTGWVLVRLQPIPRLDHVGVVQRPSTPVSLTGNTGSIPVTDTKTRVVEPRSGAVLAFLIRVGVPRVL